MLHFIIGDVNPARSDIVEVAVIFDQRTRAINTLLQDLEHGFLSALAGEKMRRVA
jgi:hypothetical protein